MASPCQSPGSIDPSSGYNSATKTFHSLRPPVPLPPPTQPLSITQYASSLLNSSSSFSPETTSFLIDAASSTRLSYSQFIEQSQSLSASLQSRFPSLSSQKVALIISPPSLHVPVLYFSLISLNVIVSPVNPLSTPSEIAHLVELCKPVIAFATTSVAKHLPALPLGTILIDSPEFLSMLNSWKTFDIPKHIHVSQSDTAAILYSSGTTGRVKGVELTHRNLIAVIANLYHNKRESPDGEELQQGVALFTLPLFHVFGFFMLIRGFALGETLVLMERFDFVKMLEAVEKYRVTYMPVSPPIVVALAKSDLVGKYDLSSLRLLGSGGAALGKETSERFTARFPNVEVAQGYGMTETGGGATGMNSQEESKWYGSGGRLSASIEGKIVHPGTGEALGPGQQGELWLRGPNIMKGYVGDDAATAETLTSDGWLKTGDLCYFDSDGFLYIVDRLKELIKYKAYQVPPAELEHIIHSIPGVADVAVIPYPDEDAGQIPMAYVVRSPGSNLSEREIQDFVAKQDRGCYGHENSNSSIDLEILYEYAAIFTYLLPGITIQEGSTCCIYQFYSKITCWKDIKKGTGESCSLWSLGKIIIEIRAGKYEVAKWATLHSCLWNYVENHPKQLGNQSARLPRSENGSCTSTKCKNFGNDCISSKLVHRYLDVEIYFYWETLEIR